MSWKKKAPLAGALGVVAIGGVAMAVPASAASVPTAEVTTQAVQQVTEGEDHERHGRRGHHHRGMRGAAVAEQLGIEVEVYRDAVKAVIEARRDAGEERPRPANMTPAERLDARADWIADLAAELGISAAELEDAHDTVFQAKLDEKVAEGKVTREEADEILAAYESGTLFDLRMEHRLERIGDKIDMLLDNGVIDDTEYDALQAALEAEDTETLRELLRELRESHGFRGRGGPGGDASANGISL